MKLKQLVTLFSAASLTGVSVAAADDYSSALQSLEVQIKALQAEVAELRTRQTTHVNSEGSESSHNPASVGDYVVVSSVLGFEHYDAPLSAQTGMYRPQQILKTMSKLEQRNDIEMVYPRVALTGLFEGTMSYQNKPGFSDSSKSDVDVAGAQFGMVIQATPWVMGEISMEYDGDSSDSSTRRTANSNIAVRDAYVTLGNLNQYPVHLSIGQFKVGPGRFGSNFLASSTYNQRVFRQTSRNIAVAGVHEIADGQSLQWSAYGFRPDIAKDSGKSHLSGFGGRVEYSGSFSDVSFNVVASAISSMASSDGAQSGVSASQTLVRKVPAAGIYAKVGKELGAGKISLLAEYNSAVKSFDKTNWSYDGQGAKPSTFNVEVAYDWSFQDTYPMTVALGYTKSWDALSIVPKKNYALTVNALPFVNSDMQIFSDALVALELKREKDYAKGVSATRYGQVATGTGKSSNTATLYLGYFF